MKGHAGTIFAVVLLVELAASGEKVGVQTSAQIGDAPLTHIGVVVRDIRATARTYADVLGIPVSPAARIHLDLPNNSSAEVKVSRLMLPNLQIELYEPISRSGPIYDHLRTFGLGVHHIGFGVQEGVDEKRSFLEQKGGNWTAGVRNGRFAFLDFREPLGTTIEVVLHAASAAEVNIPSVTGPTPKPGALGALRVAHVGMAVHDADQAARAYAETLGITAPPTRVIRPAYPPGSTWNPEAQVRLTSWQQQNTAIELVAPLGAPSPWSESLQKQRGNMVQHIAFNVGDPDQVPEIVRALEMKGGRWTNGAAGGRAAYLDFADTLGLVIEVIGTARPAPATKP